MKDMTSLLDCKKASNDISTVPSVFMSWC